MCADAGRTIEPWPLITQRIRCCILVQRGHGLVVHQIVYVIKSVAGDVDSSRVELGAVGCCPLAFRLYTLRSRLKPGARSDGGGGSGCIEVLAWVDDVWTAERDKRQQ